MWKQGEHVAIVGSTGSGKSFLEAELLRYRRSVIVIRTKADDIEFDGFKRIRKIDDIRYSDEKYLLEPVYDRQRIETAKALEHVWQAGCWTVAIDELYYVTTQLKLENAINKLLTQGRSKKITVITGMQRPSRISRFALSEITHGFFFASEGRDIKVIGESTTPRIEPVLSTLKRYQFAYFNRKERSITVARAQSLSLLLKGNRIQ